MRFLFIYFDELNKRSRSPHESGRTLEDAMMDYSYMSVSTVYSLNDFLK